MARKIKTDDELLEQCLAGTPSPERIDEALRRVVRERRLVPTFAASALRNIGVQPVLDAVVRYLPGPLDVSSAHGVLVPNPTRRSGGEGAACAADGETPSMPIPSSIPATSAERIIHADFTL